MSKDTDDDLITKTVRWMNVTSHEIRLADGDFTAVLSSIPKELLRTMVRNDLFINYAPVNSIWSLQYRNGFSDALDEIGSFINFKNGVDTSDLWAELTRLRKEVCYRNAEL